MFLCRYERDRLGDAPGHLDGRARRRDGPYRADWSGFFFADWSVSFWLTGLSLCLDVDFFDGQER